VEKKRGKYSKNSHAAFCYAREIKEKEKSPQGTVFRGGGGRKDERKKRIH